MINGEKGCVKVTPSSSNRGTDNRTADVLGLLLSAWQLNRLKPDPGGVLISGVRFGCFQGTSFPLPPPPLSVPDLFIPFLVQRYFAVGA